MPYVTVFEITHEAIPLWFPVSFVLFVVVGLIIFLDTRGLGPIVKVERYVILFFVCLWGGPASYYFLNQRREVQTYRNGNYKVVEGRVEHYSWVGKHECFTVRGVEFCHGTANQVGWDPPFRLGPSSWPVGVIFERQPVRVAYHDQGDFHIMLRLEVGATPKR